ncbi:MAG: hypothetical protein ACRDDY_06260 [Clostridium sp.]|uniref:hypothetical protein n=1 Tax=Clostridium sp. TaxID=1506 RepID=UPI003EE4F5AD
MSNFVENTINGFVHSIKIFGYTQRNCGGIFKSVGELLVDSNNKPVLNEFGEMQYRVVICSYNSDKSDRHDIEIYLPCQLESYGDVKDTLYWDDDRKEYCVLKRVGYVEGIGTIVYVDEKIIRTRITNKSFAVLRTFEGGTYLDFEGDVKGTIECVVPTTIEESNTAMVEQMESIRDDIESFNNKIPEINLHLYKLKVSTFIFDELIEFDTWANENEKARIQKMKDIEAAANSKIGELNSTKDTFTNQLNQKITEVDVNLSQHNTIVAEKIIDIQNQLDAKTSQKFTELDNNLHGILTDVSDTKTNLDKTIVKFENDESVRKSNETTRQSQENIRQQTLTNMNDKISEVDRVIASGTVDLEVKQARIGQDGTVYVNLNDRLNAMENNPYVLFETVEG